MSILDNGPSYVKLQCRSPAKKVAAVSPLVSYFRELVMKWEKDVLVGGEERYKWVFPIIPIEISTGPLKTTVYWLEWVRIRQYYSITQHRWLNVGVEMPE